MFGFFKPKSPVRLYDTRAKALVDFETSKNTVTMYHCGPTVYDYAHIGNLRAYIFADTLRRSFEFAGYKVKQVINITDIGHLVGDGDDGDDKMTKALKRLGKPLTLEAMKEVADTYTGAFIRDLDALNIKRPHFMPRASEHIKEDIALIAQLEKKGLAYKAADGMYFDTEKFGAYGALGQVNSSALHARIQAESTKHDPKDFALWKFDSALGYESPWGKGFPGWHIECSAMSRKYLGQPFDIHTGGIDHIPVHHNNEIAQSEGAYGEPLARYWMHSAFITLKGGEKMAKSEGNFLTLTKLIGDGIHPLAYRLLITQAGYRTGIEIKSSIDFLISINNTYINLLKKLIFLIDDLTIDEQWDNELPQNYMPYFSKAEINTLLNDFNTSYAFVLISNEFDINPHTHLTKQGLIRIRALNYLLGIKLFSSVIAYKRATKKYKDWETKALSASHILHKYISAKSEKDWINADNIKKEAEDFGFMIISKADGTYTLEPIINYTELTKIMLTPQ